MVAKFTNEVKILLKKEVIMEIRHSVHPDHAKHFTSDDLIKNFLVKSLFKKYEINLIYSHIDRIIVGGINPVDKELLLKAGKEIGVNYFLERREMGIINIAGSGIITIDGKKYTLDNRDALYIGMGTKEVGFSSVDKKNPARFYINSAPAHSAYSTTKISIKDANKVELGSLEESNKRTIYQYIHPDILKTCQLIMGLTILEPNNVWNTMPCHTHDRRMEVYFYFDMEPDSVVFHLFGEPTETRHIIVRNEEAVIIPSWSIHAGIGTRNYTFIWGMVGENQTFTDMDQIPMSVLK